MKYYLIAGEASGDLHASHLMKALKDHDADAQFRFFGGDLMTAQGGALVRHYRDMAYMGFIPVLLHLPTIFRNMALCKRDIDAWKPDAVVLVDYPGFNLDVAKYVHKHRAASQALPTPQVFYYISPKLWAWKEYRMRNIRRDVDQLYSILPFEKDFFERKHHYPIHYVGNPTADEVRLFRQRQSDALPVGGSSPGADVPARPPVIALLAGSRKQEIKDNLPAMIEAALPLAGHHRLVVAGAPGIEADYYETFLRRAGTRVDILYNRTYELLSQASAALVTSGTATLETALFGVPQVVCYKTPVPHLVRWAYQHVIRCRYISLVNLIADREVVQELLADRFSVANIRRELERILGDESYRRQMLSGYDDVRQALGNTSAPDNAAHLMTQLLREKQD